MLLSNFFQLVRLMLAGVRLQAVDSASLQRASRILPWEVRSLDAVHLAAAVQLRDDARIDAVLTYERQLVAGCAHHGLPVRSPTA